MSKALILFVLLSAFLGQVYNQDTQHLEAPTCSSRVISLVPKTLKYHNEVNNTKELLCKSGSLPGFAILDERCYLIISPSATGDFPMSVDITIVQRMADGSHTVSVITLSYILSISKIRYNGLSSNQEVEYDISVNRVINIETQSTSWFLKPGQQFFAQFSVNQTPKIFERVFFQFINLPHGLVGNELTGVIQGKLQVPAGYYSFAVRVFDMEGNSQTLEATILVHSEHDIFEQDDYEDQETLKAKLADVQLRMAENSATIARAKNNIEKKLEQISASRADLSDMNIQQRKLEGTQKSLAYAVNWAKGNLDTMKARFQSADQAYNDYDTIVNNAKRNYQTSVFAIQEKQSQIDKEQLQADRRFELYLKGDKNYTLIRLQLDECERRNQRISNDAIKNLKELDRANFVQNLYDIIQSK